MVDNGPEFVGRALDAPAHELGVAIQFIEPGKPIQNAFVESFHGRLRDECLSSHWFRTNPEAREELGAIRVGFNEVRPHGSLGNLMPSEFAAQHERAAS